MSRTLSSDRGISDNLTKAVLRLGRLLMKSDKYIKHDDMWCPISRHHKDPALESSHLAAAKRSQEAPAPQASTPPAVQPPTLAVTPAQVDAPKTVKSASELTTRLQAGDELVEFNSSRNWFALRRDGNVVAEVSRKAVAVLLRNKMIKTEQEGDVSQRTWTLKGQYETSRDQQKAQTTEHINPNRYEAVTDRAIADKFELYQKAGELLHRERRSLHLAARDREDRRNGSRSPLSWGLSDDVCIQRVQEQAAKAVGYQKTYLEHAITDYHDATKAVSEAFADYKRENDKYEGWSRFFLVNNAGGHIHSSQQCKTTYASTQFSWLPDVSGLNEADAVKAHGPHLCSVCFPSAPTEWTQGIKKEEDENRCPGSGQYVKKPEGATNFNWSARYQKCPVCGKTVSVTQGSSGSKYRAHKK